MTDKQIKNLIKDELNMKRVPRKLNTFYYFLWVWRLWNGKTDTTSSAPSINYLRRRYTVSTTVLQQKLSMRANEYKPYFDRFVRLNNLYNFNSGRSRSVQRWTAEANLFFTQFSDLVIPSDIISLIKNQPTPNTPSINYLREISGRTYHSTKRSPHRLYAAIQSTPKQERQTAFPGSTDCDLITCFGSMWWHHLGGKDSTLEYANLLQPQAKNILETKIMMDLGVDAEKAKKWRTKLTAPRGWRPKTSIKWFDDLQRQIMIDVMEWAQRNGCHTSHQAFTKLEQLTMSKIYATLDVWGYDYIPFHDGVIVNGVRLNDEEEELIRLISEPHEIKFKDI